MAVRTCSCTSRRSRATGTRPSPRVSVSSSRWPRATRASRRAPSARSELRVEQHQTASAPERRIRPLEGLAMVSGMAISSEDVLHVARLANLPLSDEEVAPMSEQLSGILGHVEALSQLDLDGV